MMRIRTLFVIFITSMALLVGIKHFIFSQKPPELYLEDRVILAFGDSLTYGYGASMEQSYPKQLQNLLGREVINAGVPGEVSAEGLKRLPKLLEQHNPSLLIVCHGGNDILKKKELEELHSNLEKMILIAQSHSTPVILIAVPEFGLLHLTPPALYHDLSKKYSLPIEENILSDLLHDNRYKSDLIHLNEAGYEKMAKAVEKVVREQYRMER
jgi:acyl-CoA thioesterase I